MTVQSIVRGILQNGRIDRAKYPDTWKPMIEQRIFAGGNIIRRIIYPDPVIIPDDQQKRLVSDILKGRFSRDTYPEYWQDQTVQAIVREISEDEPTPYDEHGQISELTLMMPMP